MSVLDIFILLVTCHSHSTHYTYQLIRYTAPALIPATPRVSKTGASIKTLLYNIPTHRLWSHVCCCCCCAVIPPRPPEDLALAARKIGTPQMMNAFPSILHVARKHRNREDAMHTCTHHVCMLCASSMPLTGSVQLFFRFFYQQCIIIIHLLRSRRACCFGHLGMVFRTTV